MSAICGGAASEPKPGFDLTLRVSPNMIGALWQNASVPEAVAIAGYIGYLVYNLSTFCPADPPDPDPIDAGDILALLNPLNPFAFLPARQKFQDWIGKMLWPVVCQCSDGSIPGSLSAPTWPSGAPALDPVAIGPYPGGSPCLTESHSDTFPSGANTDFGFSPLRPLPAGVTYGSVDVVTDGRTLIGAEVESAYVEWFNATTSLGFFTAGKNSSSNVLHAEGAVPSGTTQFRMVRHASTATEPLQLDSTFHLYCGTTPSGGGGAITNPCPTDPITLGFLDQILQLVTLIQRQQVPFAYVDGDVHSGLTGSGHIDIQGLIGARLLLTGFGSNTGSINGDPDVFSNAGWINWSNADGAMRREFITCSPMVTLPPLAGQFTRIGYTLEPGVELQITELVREA